MSDKKAQNLETNNQMLQSLNYQVPDYSQKAFKEDIKRNDQKPVIQEKANEEIQPNKE